MHVATDRALDSAASAISIRQVTQRLMDYRKPSVVLSVMQKASAGPDHVMARIVLIESANRQSDSHPPAGQPQRSGHDGRHLLRRPAAVRDSHLRPRALHLSDEGWGAIHVLEADDGWDEPAEPKTGERTVPIPPELAGLLRAWIDEHRFGPDDLLFRTRNGKRPTQSNWGRALKRACRAAGFRPLTPYDGRHACATTWLRSGVPLGEAPRRLGHTVETLVSTYIGALDGDDLAANKLIDEAIGPALASMTERERREQSQRKSANVRNTQQAVPPR